MATANKRTRQRYRMEGEMVCVDLNVSTVHQLFDQRDPAPFRAKDLEDDAVEYIVGAVREIGARVPMKLVVHLQKASDVLEEEDLQTSIRSFFSYEAELYRRKLKLHFKQSQISLVIGLTCLFLFTYLSNQITAFGEGLPFVMLHEGINILGWVAMWKPIELILYLWWPIWLEKKVFDRLSQVDVQVIAKPTLEEIPNNAVGV